jgi:hypothetical protein
LRRIVRVLYVYCRGERRFCGKGIMANEDDRSRRIATRRAPAPRSRSRSCRRRRRRLRDHKRSNCWGWSGVCEGRCSWSMIVDMRVSHTMDRKIHTMNTTTQPHHALACTQVRELLLKLFCGGDGHVQCLDPSAPQMRGRGSGVVSTHYGQRNEGCYTAIS